MYNVADNIWDNHICSNIARGSFKKIDNDEPISSKDISQLLDRMNGNDKTRIRNVEVIGNANNPISAYGKCGILVGVDILINIC